MTERIALVTGAAKGIGEACVWRFLREGMTVVGVATSPLAVELAAQSRLHFVVGDVADPATWERVSDMLDQLGGALEALVLDAAQVFAGTVLDVPLEDWRRVFETNVFGAVLGAQACLPRMIERGKGQIVIVSSVNGWMAEQGLIAYSCTKATLIEMTKSLAVDHAHQGIRANVVAPGTTDTPTFRPCDGLLRPRRALDRHAGPS